MGLFSCTKCRHFTAGSIPRCARGRELTTAASLPTGGVGLVIIEDGCDDFTLSPEKEKGSGTSAGGNPIRRSARCRAARSDFAAPARLWFRHNA